MGYQFNPFTGSLDLAGSGASPGAKLVGVETLGALTDLTSADVNTSDIVAVGQVSATLNFTDNVIDDTYRATAVVPTTKLWSDYGGQTFSGFTFVLSDSLTNPSTGVAWGAEHKIAVPTGANATQVAAAIARCYLEYMALIDHPDTSISSSGNILSFSSSEGDYLTTDAGITVTMLPEQRIYREGMHFVINGVTVLINSSDPDDEEYAEGSLIATRFSDYINFLPATKASATRDVDVVTIVTHYGGTVYASGDPVNAEGLQSLTPLSAPQYFLVTDTSRLGTINAFTAFIPDVVGDETAHTGSGFGWTGYVRGYDGDGTRFWSPLPTLFSGDYNDLSNKPAHLPNQDVNTGSEVQFSGATFNDGTGTPYLEIRDSYEDDDGLTVAQHVTSFAPFSCKTLTVTTPTVPTSASSTGVTGTIAYSSTYLYVCVSTNTWKRVAISTW